MSTIEAIASETWRKVVKRSLNTADFDIVNFKTRKLSEGGGFVGEHRLVEITVRRSNAKQHCETLNFFFKGQPQDLPNQRQLVEQSGSFKKEVDALTILFVDLKSVLEDGGKNMEWGCKCFHAESDFIILEDLAVQGFRVGTTIDELSYQHCAAVLKSLANLHSSSLIYESKYPCVNDKYSSILKEGFFRRAPNHPGIPWMESSIKTVCCLIEAIWGLEFLATRKEQIQNTMESLFELVKTSSRFRNTVTHGDLWKNNIFFKTFEDGSVEARLVDYQCIRYTPPAVDIMDFFHISTTRNFRDLYGSQLISFYHGELSKNLKRHEIDPEVVFPWEEFKESCKFYRQLGIVTSCCYCPVTSMNEDFYKHVFDSSSEYERFLKVDRSPEVLRSFRNDSEYREKITGVIEELIELCDIK